MGDYLSVFFLTLTNPAYILIFVALFAALGISHEGIPLGGGMSMILGVLCGASLWWFTLTFGVSFLRRKFRPRHLLWMNPHLGQRDSSCGSRRHIVHFLSYARSP